MLKHLLIKFHFPHESFKYVLGSMPCFVWSFKGTPSKNLVCAAFIFLVFSVSEIIFFAVSRLSIQRLEIAKNDLQHRIAKEVTILLLKS